MAEKIKVTVWNEGRHEKSDADAKAMYPNGIHGAIKEFLDKNEDMEVRAVTLDDPDQGLPDSLLGDTDVLLGYKYADDLFRKLYTAMLVN